MEAGTDLEKTQVPIFPPELLTSSDLDLGTSVTFKGSKWTWHAPSSLKELLALKSSHPEAPLIGGNITAGLFISSIK